MTTQTLSQLRQLKLGGMAHALQTQLEQVGTYEELAFVERLTLLVEQECLNREQRKQERLIRQARFKLQASIQEIDHDRTFAGPDVSAVRVWCTVETRDRDHVEALRARLEADGIQVSSGQG